MIIRYHKTQRFSANITLGNITHVRMIITGENWFKQTRHVFNITVWGLYMELVLFPFG